MVFPSVGNFVQHVAGLSSILNYMSPEQLRGEATDLRSNLFSLGAMFYEMVTEHKAFDAKRPRESSGKAFWRALPPPRST